MIIEGAPAGNVNFWIKHLQRKDTNEAMYVRDVRGTLATDLEGALLEMQAVASGSRSHGNFMYQANINPLASEHLTPEQWEEAIDTLEKNLGLEGHQRVAVEHVKDGRQHYHILWNRVDVDTMRVQDMGGNYYTHERTARQLEQAFGLERAPRVYGERQGERVSKRTDLWEYDRGHESGQSPRAIKAEITTLWNAAPDGRTFIEAIERHGYILAKGDRRDFCIIDRAGDEHSLARRLDGVTARQLREHLAFIDRDILPSVTEAKELHADRQAGLERTPGEEAWTRDGRADTAWENQLAAAAVEKAEAEDRERQQDMEKLWRAYKADNAALRDNQALRDAQNYAFWSEYREKQDALRDERVAAWEEYAQESCDRAEGKGEELSKIGEGADRVAAAGVKVFDAAAEAFTALADFVADFLSSFVAPPEPKRTAFQQLDQDPAERVAAIKASRRAGAALESIAGDLESGNTVKAEDIRNLAPADLQNIRDRGDAALLDMVRRLEEERERDQGRSRDR